MTKIYLIRHAHVANPSNVNYGRLAGFRLSEEGTGQANKLKRIFANKNIDLIYASPLLRTKQTAQIIADGKFPIEYSKSLLEVDFGKLEGRPIELTLAPRKRAHLDNNFPKESYQKVQERMVKKILLIADRHSGKNILVITHADPILTARLFFEGKGLKGIEKMPTVNGSATILTFNDKLQCKKVEYKNLVDAKEDF